MTQLYLLASANSTRLVLLRGYLVTPTYSWWHEPIGINKLILKFEVIPIFCVARVLTKDKPINFYEGENIFPIQSNNLYLLWGRDRRRRVPNNYKGSECSPECTIVFDTFVREKCIERRLVKRSFSIKKSLENLSDLELLDIFIIIGA